MRLKRTHNCGELRKTDCGGEPVIAGWVDTNRDHGGVIFIDLRDRYAMTQLVFNPEDNAELHAEGLAVFADHYGRHLLDNTTLYPGVLDVLARFQRIPMHLATNKPRSFTDPILAGLHLAGAFRKVVCGDETPERKPDPVHLRVCLEGLDVAPADVVVVGDSPNDVNAARALGAVSVACTFGLVQPGLLKSSDPDFAIDSMGELAGLFPSRQDHLP